MSLINFNSSAGLHVNHASLTHAMTLLNIALFTANTANEGK